MRINATWGTLMLLLASAGPAAGQAASSWITTVGGGLTAPIGNAADVMKAGYHGVVTIGRREAGSPITWAIDASYHRNAAKAVDGEHNNIFLAMARVNYDAGRNLYLIGAAGVLRNEFKNSQVQPTVTSTTSAFAISGGVGLTFGTSLFAEARLVNGFTSGKSTTLIPITVGIRF